MLRKTIKIRTSIQLTFITGADDAISAEAFLASITRLLGPSLQELLPGLGRLWLLNGSFTVACPVRTISALACVPLNISDENSPASALMKYTPMSRLRCPPITVELDDSVKKIVRQHEHLQVQCPEDMNFWMEHMLPWRFRSFQYHRCSVAELKHFEVEQFFSFY